MRIIGVIPARYGSSRFPGKPLIAIKGVPLIERVWRRASRSKRLDDIIVATDDSRIADAVRAFGGKAVMTSPRCASGTDRLAEVARKTEPRAGIFINIQGDEPLIPPALIDKLAGGLLQDKSVPAITAAARMTDPGEISNPNIVKVVCDRRGKALYFSRASIPFQRSGDKGRYLKHIGIYGYRRQFLLEYAGWPRTALERAEQLEQLRILEHGYSLRVVVTTYAAHGVDVPEDIASIERLLQ